MFRLLVGLFTALFALGAPAFAGGLLEPALRLPASSGAPRVALTLDACGGQTDQRILSMLVEQKIPATIFVTGKWLRRNPAALAVLKANPDLFEIENHGAMHVPMVATQSHVFGLKTAGSTAAVTAEVDGGAKAIVAAGLPQPKWFRGATAEYDPASLKQIEAMGFRIAGFSLNGDQGATSSAHTATSRIEKAKDGEVIIAHMNQPKRVSGAGVAAAIIALKARGYQFVKLGDALEQPVVLGLNKAP